MLEGVDRTLRNGCPVRAGPVDLGDPASRADFLKLWPIGKFPVLRDESKDRTLPESTVIIEYLAQHYPGASELLPADPDLARQTRFRDRFYDLYVNVPMQKVVTDKMRPPGRNDSHGVEAARQQLATALDMIEKDIAGKTWAMGDTFSMVDCAAAPPLFYANMLKPFGDSHPHTAAYLRRLMERPSYARAVAEARPYFALMPQ